MANFKRKKPRRKVRCVLCTDARIGNSKKDVGRFHRKHMLEEIVVEKEMKNDA